MLVINKNLRINDLHLKYKTTANYSFVLINIGMYGFGQNVIFKFSRT